MTIRTATEADIPLLRDLAQRIWRECYPGIITPEQIEFMLGWMYSEGKVREELRAGITWEIAVEGDAPGCNSAAGFLSFSREDDGRVKLHKMYVLLERQRITVESRIRELEMWQGKAAEPEHERKTDRCGRRCDPGRGDHPAPTRQHSCEEGQQEHMLWPVCDKVEHPARTPAEPKPVAKAKRCQPGSKKSQHPQNDTNWIPHECSLQQDQRAASRAAAGSMSPS